MLVKSYLVFMQSKICSYTHEIDEHDRASSDFGNPIAERSSGVPKNGGSLIEQVRHYDPCFLLIFLKN